MYFNQPQIIYTAQYQFDRIIPTYSFSNLKGNSCDTFGEEVIEFLVTVQSN